MITYYYIEILYYKKGALVAKNKNFKDRTDEWLKKKIEAASMNGGIEADYINIWVSDSKVDNKTHKVKEKDKE